MTDTLNDGGDQLSADAESLIDEIINSGFSYDSNDRLVGLARQGEADGGGPDADEGSDEPAGAPGGSDDDPADDDDDAAGDDDGSDGAGGSSGGDAGGDQTEDPSGGAAPGPLDGLSSEEQAGLLQVRRMLLEHPELAEKFAGDVRQVMAGGSLKSTEEIAAEKAEAEKLPDWVDPDEPAQVAMFRRNQELEARMTSLERSGEASQQAMSQAQVRADIAAGVDRFKAAHPDLNDDDINNIRNHTKASVNVPGVMANFPDDPIEGIARALEIGSMTDPATRDKVLGINKTNPSEADKKRQKNLSGLSGSTGSAPRRPGKTKPAGNWNEVAHRLAKELEAMGPTT